MIGIFVLGQSIRLPTSRDSKDDFFEKSQSILPIYKYENKTIEPYSKFGLALDEKLPWYTIKQLPIMQNCRDTGYTYIYFSGADNNQREGYILCMVGNYIRSRRTVYLYIDRNNDLDFTNDGAPDSLTSYQNDVDITLKNTSAPEARYTFKLTRFNYGENIPYKKLLTEHYTAHSGNKKFTKINYCYREQRYNVAVANYTNKTDSFTLGIKDMNVNGLYNDGCVDKLYIGPYKSQVISDELKIIKPIISDNTFEWSGKTYRITQIESSGKYIEFYEDQSLESNSQLKLGKKTPNFTYFNVFNMKHELKEFKKQEVYLFFWDKLTISDEDKLYLSLLNNEFSDRIKLITLNHGDQPKQVKIMFYYDKIDWPVGFSHAEIASQYFLENVPRGYYLGKHRKLINDKISPKELYQLIKK